MTFFGQIMATSQLPPEAREYYSQDRDYKFEIMPPRDITVIDALALQKGDYLQITMRYPSRPPSDFLVFGKLSVLRNGKYTTIWQRVLENSVSPLYAIIKKTSSGVRIITLNDYFLFRNSPASIVVYSQTGSTLTKIPLSEVTSERDLNKAFEKNDSVDLLREFQISGEELIITVTDTITKIDLANGAVLQTKQANLTDHKKKKK